MQFRNSSKKICFVVSSAMTINAFLQEPIRMLAQENEIYVAANLRKSDSIPVITDSRRLIPIPLERKVSIYKDIVALIFLIRLFRKHRFDIVHSMTPKAGFIVMVASYIAGIKIRIHTFTGQVWYTRTGLKRYFLKQLDKIAALFSSHVLVDSPTQEAFLLAEGVISKKKSTVLGKGSVSGVDLNKFKPNLAARDALRSALRINKKDIVILFLGRLAVDKGVLDLASAFVHLRKNRKSVRLLVVGPDEENLLVEMKAIAKDYIDSFYHIDFTDKPQDYMAASDILCLPSYREGFGGVVIEAAAVGIPAVGSRIYGLMDSIAENESGLLYEIRDVSELTQCLLTLVDDDELRLQLGENSRKRVEKYFSSKLLAEAWFDYYSTKL